MVRQCILIIFYYKCLVIGVQGPTSSIFTINNQRIRDILRKLTCVGPVASTAEQIDFLWESEEEEEEEREEEEEQEEEEEEQEEEACAHYHLIKKVHKEQW